MLFIYFSDAIFLVKSHLSQNVAKLYQTFPKKKLTHSKSLTMMIHYFKSVTIYPELHYMSSWSNFLNAREHNFAKFAMTEKAAKTMRYWLLCLRIILLCKTKRQYISLAVGRFGYFTSRNRCWRRRSRNKQNLQAHDMHWAPMSTK